MNIFSKIVAVFLVTTSFFVIPVSAETAKSANVAATKVAAESQAAVQPATVNINTADAATLANGLNGVGIKKAEAIVAHRQQNGPFKSADDLANVTGIGPATVEKNRSIITIN